MEYEHIPQEQFAFAQLDATLHDKKLETKNRSFFADAMIRFKKNKSSVIAAYILLFLLIFTFAAPIISPYTMDNKDKFYVNTPPYIESIAQKGWGIFDGAVVRESQNEASMNYWKGIAEETGMNPVIKVLGQTGTTSIFRGKEKITYTYTIETNKYYETGMIYRTFSYEEFDAIQEWQNETGIQVIYPYVETKDIQGITDNPNLWYEVDAKGAAKLDKDGNFVPVYSTNKEVEGRLLHLQCQ